MIHNIQDIFTSISHDKKCLFFNDKSKEGLFLFSKGKKEKCDPGRIADTAFEIHNVLMKNKKNLHGFNILISILAETNPLNALAQQKNNLFLLDEEEYVWITKNEYDYFSKYLIFEKKGNFYKVEKKEDQYNKHSIFLKDFWLRQSSYNQLFDEITPIMNGLENNKIILIHGENGIGKTTIVSHIVKSILKEDYEYTPRMYTFFKRRSFVHPFLNSIHPGFLRKIPEYLLQYENPIWSFHGKLLSCLKSGEEAGECPDHFFEDFLIGYNIYLSAFLRMMTNRLMPAFFICDDIDAYADTTYKGLQILLGDFLKNPTFIPLFISQSGQIPEILQRFPAKEIEIKPVNQRETRKLIHAYYPGIKLTKKILRNLLEYSKAQILPIKSYLAYCIPGGIIKKIKNSYVWNPEKKEDIPPDNQSKILIFLLKTLRQNEIDILYYIYLSAGMLTTEGLYSFLESNSYPRDIAESVLLILFHYGLISTGDYTTPYYTGLKKQIEDLLQSRTEYLCEVYLNYIQELWKEKRLSRYVLLFSLFMTHKKISPALEILHLLIKRKIDEWDINEVKPFLSLKNPVIKHKLDEEERKQLRMIILAGQLRLSLLEGNHEQAEIIINLINEENPYLDRASSYRGDLFLHMASYFNIKEDIDEAVSLTKKALLDFQDLGLLEKKAYAYIELGAIMLADQKIGDAYDYLNLSCHLFSEDDMYPCNKIRILLLTGICYYLEGNLTKSLDSSLNAQTISMETGIRNWELTSIFLAGRIYFDLGLYSDAQEKFIEGLSIISVYSIKEARQVFYAWLGRSYIYSGMIKDGLKTLNKVKPNREIFYFLAEAYFFLRQYNKAFNFIEKGMEIPSTYSSLPDEREEWIDGISLVEEKYSKASIKGTILNRIVKVFRAYLLSLCHGLKEGIVEFYQIIRTEKDAKNDPYFSFYYFLYSQLLSKCGEDEVDDYLTILNKALKQLQERASRIENPSDRKKYLFNNFWNNHIFNEAKKKNLI
ncbi:MAG: ATP-binding protein [Spirochaetales bacterium]|nr:ATP-binding protein [Spirochaetales bacterium]